MLVGLISSLYLLVVTPAFGLPGVWSGLFLFMMLRLIAGIWRYNFRRSSDSTEHFIFSLVANLSDLSLFHLPQIGHEEWAMGDGFQ